MRRKYLANGLPNLDYEGNHGKSCICLACHPERMGKPTEPDDPIPCWPHWEKASTFCWTCHVQYGTRYEKQ